MFFGFMLHQTLAMAANSEADALPYMQRVHGASVGIGNQLEANWPQQHFGATVGLRLQIANLVVRASSDSSSQFGRGWWLGPMPYKGVRGSGRGSKRFEGPRGFEW